jgi:beta-lactamase class D
MKNWPGKRSRVIVPGMRTILVFLGASLLVGCGAAQSAPVVKTKTADETATATAEKPRDSQVDAKRFFGDARGCFTMRNMGTGETFEMGGDECAERTLPASTFKVPNAIIALDSGVLKDEKTVLKWDGEKRWLEDWNRDHALPTSMWYSVVWFYQVIAKDVGTDRYRKYLSDFHYGNADPSGDVTKFWLNSTLLISPREQVTFLATMYEGKLPASARSVEIVKKILELRGEAKSHVRERFPFVDKIPENVILSGKTGSAWPDKKPLGPTDVVGWFVGSLERDGNRWVFASRIRSSDEEKIGPAAARIAYDILHERGML